MAKKRMAGEELERDNPVAEEARNSVADAADRNSAARERIAASPERSKERLSSISSDYDLEGYSDKEVIMAYKGGGFGDDDYARLTGNPLDDANPDPDPVVEAPDTTPVAPPSNPAPSQPPVTPGPPMGGSTLTQIVNQDNDVNSNVTGDNNDVNINQDNSVRQFGGYTSDMNAGNKRAALGATNLMDNYVLNLRKTKTTI